MERVLITSAGGLVGTYLIKHFREIGNYYLVGTDMSEYVPLKKSLDACYVTAASKEKKYIDEIEEIIEKEQIDIVVPVSSYDIEIYSKQETMKRLEPAKMLLMDYEIHRVLHNKRLCNEFLRNIGISVPNLYLDENAMVFPCILKPNESSGSKNVKCIESKDDFLYWKKKIQNYTLFQYLEGKEYTVDCLFDYSGKCVGYNSRERVKMNGGGAVISKCVKEEGLIEIIKKLEELGNIKGPINFQYKLIGSKICIFDFNTRFASGGLPLSVHVGFDIPKMLIDLVMGKEVKKWKIPEEYVGYTMLRYYEESYISE